jgi:hypothetical protein
MKCSCELTIDVNLVHKILVKNITLSYLVAEAVIIVFGHIYTVNFSFDVIMSLRQKAGTF